MVEQLVFEEVHEGAADASFRVVRADIDFLHPREDDGAGAGDLSSHMEPATRAATACCYDDTIP